jgi:SAM-dependent methyltransferase
MKISVRHYMVCGLCVAAIGFGAAAMAAEPYEPMVGQDGKDVIWVPTPDAMVDKMLEVAGVTPQDFVMDLGSGDGRNVIGAARRGARGIGVEYNSELVDYSRQRAAAAGVAGRAQFVQGDMYAADISQANVLMLFLLPDNLRALMPKVLDMKAGSRIVSNTYEFPAWAAEKSETVRESCAAFCIVFLYVVPAKVAGNWRMPEGELVLEQDFQRVTGAYVFNGISLPLENGRLNGAEFRFTVNGVEYLGRVDGDTIEGTAKGRNGSLSWRATLL